MEIHLVDQDFGTKICGSCCIAMITGKPVEEIVKMFGHRRGTTTKEVVSVLNQLGYECEAPLVRISDNTELPDLAILKVNWDSNTRHSHWVVYHEGWVYCSVAGKYLYEDINCMSAEATSYLEINLY